MVYIKSIKTHIGRPKIGVFSAVVSGLLGLVEDSIFVATLGHIAPSWRLSFLFWNLPRSTGRDKE